MLVTGDWVPGVRKIAVLRANALGDLIVTLPALEALRAAYPENDTGPRHLAEAVGAPTVGIYWCFNMINADPTTRTLHRPLVSWTLACPICGRS